jgi:hypothetical protein
MDDKQCDGRDPAIRPIASQNIEGILIHHLLHNELSGMIGRGSPTQPLF